MAIGNALAEQALANNGRLDLDIDVAKTPAGWFVGTGVSYDSDNFSLDFNYARYPDYDYGDYYGHRGYGGYGGYGGYAGFGYGYADYGYGYAGYGPSYAYGCNYGYPYRRCGYAGYGYGYGYGYGCGYGAWYPGRFSSYGYGPGFHLSGFYSDWGLSLGYYGSSSYGGSTTYVYDSSPTVLPIVVENEVIYLNGPSEDAAQGTAERKPDALPTNVPQPEFEGSLADRATAAAHPYVTQAMTAFYARDYDTARRDFSAAMLVAPGDAAPRVGYGLAYFAVGRYRAAAKSFRRAVTLDPELLQGGVNLDGLYADQATLTEQRAVLEQFLKDNPQDQHAWLTLAYVDMIAGRLSTAGPAASTAWQLDPGDVVAELLLDAIETRSKNAGGGMLPDVIDSNFLN